MKLPKAHLAIVRQEKIVGYLLNAAHPDNGGKAAFFAKLGFSEERWEELAAAILSIAIKDEVLERVESAHGLKFVVDGIIGRPSGPSAICRTIWIVDQGAELPRLVTAYPAKG